MKLECRTGNTRIPCTINQALAFLLQNGLPKIDNRKSHTGKLVFISHVPLSFHGPAHQLRWLRDELTGLRQSPPVNGAIIVKWMELMRVPVEYLDTCHTLSPNMLAVVWAQALLQNIPITIVLKVFTT